ncbi:MAG: VanZ family protein [Nitrospirae bacterium]|nr:VanZ family protein [Nitrospirota bacterium]
MRETENINIRKAVVLWLITGIYMGLIFYLSSRTWETPELPTDFDKVIHAVIYIPLAFLFYLSLKKSGLKRNVFITAVFLTVLYGISDELHQSYVPGRESSIADAFADFAGAMLGSLAATFLKT